MGSEERPSAWSSGRDGTHPRVSVPLLPQFLGRSLKKEKNNAECSGWNPGIFWKSECTWMFDSPRKVYPPGL